MRFERGIPTEIGEYSSEQIFTQEDSLTKNAAEQAALEVEKKSKGKTSIKEILEAVKDKIIDWSPDFFVNTDRLISAYWQKVRKSENLGNTTADFFDFLQQKGLRRPDREFKSDSRHMSDLALLASIRTTNATQYSQQFARKSEKIKAVKEILNQSEHAQHFQESEVHGGKLQKFGKTIMQPGGNNEVDEFVENFIEGPELNFASSRLFIHDKVSGKTLDLGQFLPPGFEFTPGRKIVIKKVEGREGAPEYVPGRESLDLRDYKGIDQEEENDNFYMSPSPFNKVGYGDITKKGGMLSLLHEITHAWQSKYREGSGRFNLERYLREVTLAVDMIQFYRKLEQIPETSKSAKVQISAAEAMLNMSGVNVDIDDYADDGRELGDETYKIQALDWRNQDQVKYRPLYVKSDKIKPLVRDYVSEERDAWAHAIRVLKFLRKQGFDLEPELKTGEDIMEEVHKNLNTYQRSIEANIGGAERVKAFTNKRKYEKKTEDQDQNKNLAS